jgi:hypothetical protein
MTMSKTPAKMQTYLSKLGAMGLSQVRLLIPQEAEADMQQMAEATRYKYLQGIVRTADDADPRLAALAQSNLAVAVKPYKITEWRENLTPSQHILFDKKVLTMQEHWSSMVMATARASMKQDAEATRHKAEAALSAIAYKSAKDALIAYVLLNT